MIFFSKLSSQQRALLLAFAETEQNIDGNVKGMRDSTEGKQRILIGDDTFVQVED